MTVANHLSLAGQSRICTDQEKTNLDWERCKTRKQKVVAAQQDLGAWDSHLTEGKRRAGCAGTVPRWPSSLLPHADECQHASTTVLPPLADLIELWPMLPIAGSKQLVDKVAGQLGGHLGMEV
jgi:hypothetical protein